MNILELLEAKGIDYISKGGEEYAIVCPTQHLHAGGQDSKPSCNINIVKEVCQCLSCGFKLNQVGMHKWLLGEDLDEFQMKGMELAAVFKKLETPQVSLIEEDKEVFFPVGEPWTEDGYRNISIETYTRLGAVKVTRGRYSNRICFKIIVNGVLVGVDARALGDEQPKYLRNSKATVRRNWAYPYDIVKEMKPKKVLLAEGIFHAVNALDKGFPALCYFGAHNFSQDKVMMLLALGVDEVIVCPDPDIPGWQAAERICAALGEWFKVTVADMTPYYESGKDLGDLTKEEINTAVANRGKPILPLCLLENWDFKIKYGAECKKWKCRNINRKIGVCEHRLYAPQE